MTVKTQTKKTDPGAPRSRSQKTLPDLSTAEMDSIPRQLKNLAASAWQWLVAKRRLHFGAKRLRISETVSLGEKRFVAILELDGQQFLVGGAPGSIAIMAQLSQEESAAKAAAHPRPERRTRKAEPRSVRTIAPVTPETKQVFSELLAQHRGERVAR